LNETEKLTVGVLVSALALIAPGFLLHVAPRFPGSFAGSMFGIAAAILLLLLLVYSLVKRRAWIKKRVTAHASLRAILSFHVYAGVVGALLGIVHSGHAFNSPLGIALVLTMLVVVFSGFAGHYYVLQLGTELKDQQGMLAVLRVRYDAIAGGLAGRPLPAGVNAAEVPMPRLLGAMADLEGSIKERETLKSGLARWVGVHVGAALIMYSLLVLHIWNGIYYGLRWLG